MDLVKTDQATASEGADIFRRVVDFHPRCVAEGVGTLHPGEVLDERFVITEVVSRSGMSMIFRAQDLHNGNECRARGGKDGEQALGFCGLAIG